MGGLAPGLGSCLLLAGTQGTSLPRPISQSGPPGGAPQPARFPLKQDLGFREGWTGFLWEVRYPVCPLPPGAEGRFSQGPTAVFLTQAPVSGEAAAPTRRRLPQDGRCPRTGAAPGRALPGAMPRGRSDRPGPAPPLRLIESSGNHPSLAGLWAPIPRAQAGTNGGLSPPSPGQGSHMLLGPFSGPSFVHVSQSLHWGGGGLPHSCLASPLPWISTCPVKPQPTPRAGTARNGPRTVVCLRGPRSPSPSALGATWNVLLCSLDQSFCP